MEELAALFFFGVGVGAFSVFVLYSDYSVRLMNRMKKEQWQDDSEWARSVKACPPPPPGEYFPKGF